MFINFKVSTSSILGVRCLPIALLKVGFKMGCITHLQFVFIVKFVWYISIRSKYEYNQKKNPIFLCFLPIPIILSIQPIIAIIEEDKYIPINLPDGLSYNVNNKKVARVYVRDNHGRAYSAKCGEFVGTENALCSDKKNLAMILLVMVLVLSRLQIERIIILMMLLSLGVSLSTKRPKKSSMFLRQRVI